MTFVLHLLLTLLHFLLQIQAKTNWIDSSHNIHSFLTFDSKTNAANINTHGKAIDFVWGATEHNVNVWRNSSNKDVVLSYYMPFSRDPKPHPTGTPPTSLPWWIQHYPTFVLYQCDRVTPAWECFAGEGCSHVSVPLDLTNPSVLEYQLNVAVAPAKKIGYNAIALDNYSLRNEWKACGAFKGKNGEWVQLYDKTDPQNDPQYAKDVLDWTQRATEQMHALDLLVIPNFNVQNFETETLQVTNLTDGILAEGGFVSWNPIPNTSSFTTPPVFTTPSKFALQIQFIRHLQRNGKGFYSINEWGIGPDYNLNPSCRKYSKRRRSNVALIIVRILFICSFLFYCLLYNHSFQTNPNSITNCLKLFSLLQLYNYIAPASLF